LKEIQIHATNINGLGAINVANAIISALDLCEDISIKDIYSSKDIVRVSKFGKLSIYNRFLPNRISRLIEVIFSNILFKNIPTLVLGDIPLRGIKNQVLYVHQPNLIKPNINHFSSKSLKFKILRFLFSYNLKYVRSIIVQTDYMKDNLIQSYKNLGCPIIVLPLPPINIKQDNWENKIKHKIKLIYPASFYPHKNHDFLYRLEKHTNNYEIWVTLEDKDFQKFKHLKFVKNLGLLSHKEVISKYKEANALVNFSNLESFCLPLVESIYLNIPILTIDRDYSRWMCEDFAYYFKDTKTFEKSLNNLEGDLKADKLKPLYKAKNKFKYTWNDVANKMISAL
jgi:hypothetical protein